MSLARIRFTAGLLLLLSLSATAQAQDLQPFEAAAKKIETAIQENDAKIFPQLFDTKDFLRRIFLNLPAAPEEFKKGFSQPISTMGRQVFAEWAKAGQEGGGLRLLRVRTVEGEPRALMRLVSSQGLNYIDIIFSTDGGPPRMVDAYVTLSGEKLSDTISRVAGLALTPDAAGGNDLVVHGKTLQEFTRLTRSAVPKEALKLHDTLPAKLKEEKMIMVLVVVNRMRLHDENPQAYMQSIDDFVKKFPNDPAVDLITLDGYFLRKDYPGGLAAVDRLEKAIGGDVYLNLFRSTLTMLQMKPNDARKYLDQVVAAEPDLKQGWMNMIDVTLAQRDYPKLAETLTTLEEKFEMNLPGVATAPVFESFRKSPEYAKWKARGN